MQAHAVRRRDVGVVDRVVEVAPAVGGRAVHAAVVLAGPALGDLAQPVLDPVPLRSRACCSLADFLLLGGSDRLPLDPQRSDLGGDLLLGGLGLCFERPAWSRGSRRPRSGVSCDLVAGLLAPALRSASGSPRRPGAAAAPTPALLPTRVEPLEGVDGVLAWSAESSPRPRLSVLSPPPWYVDSANVGELGPLIVDGLPAAGEVCACVVAAGRSPPRAAPASPGRARSPPAPATRRSASRACAAASVCDAGVDPRLRADQLRRDLVDVVLLVLDLVLHRRCRRCFRSSSSAELGAGMHEAGDEEGHDEAQPHRAPDPSRAPEGEVTVHV